MEYFNNKFEEKQFSTDFKKFFLLLFTKELIKGISSDDVLKLKTVLNEEEKERREIELFLKKAKKKREKAEKKLEGKSHLSIMHELPPFPEKKIDEPIPNFNVPQLPKIEIPLNQNIKQNNYMKRYAMGQHFIGPLRIPELVFPQRLQYLKPIPREEHIDIGKLNALLRDPGIKVIECNGHDEPVMIDGIIGRRKSKINLTSDEIKDIVYKFSQATKIPVNEGVYRVVYGRYIFSAIISEVVASKFIIKKMEVMPYYGIPYQQNQAMFTQRPTRGRF